MSESTSSWRSWRHESSVFLPAVPILMNLSVLGKGAFAGFCPEGMLGLKSQMSVEFTDAEISVSEDSQKWPASSEEEACM